MALPNKVIEQLSRAPARTPGWSSRVLLFSVTFCVLSGGIYLGIQFGYRPFIEGQIKELDRQIDEFTRTVSPTQQEELVSFYSQVDNLNRLLAQQAQASNLFPWLEANTNTQVQLDSLSLNALKREVVLGGQANDMVYLGQQINRFESLPEVINVQLSQLTLNQQTGKWNFSLTVALREDFFKPTPMTLLPEDVSDSQPITEDSDASTLSPDTSSSEAPPSSE